MTSAERALVVALDTLEDVDARYLVWGLVDESWQESELLGRIEGALPETDARQILRLLVDEGLVVEVPGSYPRRYRTRMAEAMRLLSRLRQLFPRRPWRSSARLVADFRFRHEPRRFPRRDMAPETVLERLSALGLDQPFLDASRAVLGGRDLSAFQLRAAIAVLDALDARTDRGVVVGAGTGSGKTLAFYLPALAHLASIARTGDATGAIAVYPRNELLKDQLATALHEVRQLRASGGRQLRLGAYFGPAPLSSRHDPEERAGWRRTRSGFICPFLSCPETGCGGRLVWLSRDRLQGQERLTCDQCNAIVDDSEFALTRAAMQQRPPDVVFTTTEMLNRSLSDGWSMHVFGVGPNVRRSPSLILLDEVHTYEGVPGAQAAFLLRRWRHLVGRPLTWVGLSATLANASTFFAALCGLSDDAVADVRPEPDELRDLGREYQVVLRGDPTSQTALLSTSIQALMLLRRVLDAGQGENGTFGSRVFAFCDNLDLVNRLYRQVLDAEGRDPLGRPDRDGHLLAGLRFPSYAERYGAVPDWQERDADGQHWWLPEAIGFGDRSLVVTRTSSQDRGVDQRADIVVATASLEVGYDDPEVGAVLQHKAPRDGAQFLQRRGRAGRMQHQRPWTVVVLSDYGRDRAAYQDHETLLDPDLPAKSLPLGNQSVRKMQAAMCLLEWTAARLGVAGNTKRSVRSVFVGPDANQQFRQAVAALLTRVLDGGTECDELVSYVGASLRLDADQLVTVCWEQPRSLLLDVVPTAVRRLESTWGAYADGQVVPRAEPWVRDHPLPEFIPRSLFSDLCLPEVTIHPPDGYDPAAETSLPVAMALNELAPGRVTLRWAVRKVRGLWIPPPAYGSPLDLDEHLAPGGEVLREVPGLDGSVPLVRPVAVQPVVPEQGVLDSSNGRLQWEFLAEPIHAGLELARPRLGPFDGIVMSVTAYLHAGRGALRTWRYAGSGTSDVARRSGRERSSYSFTRHGVPAAIGFEAIVDALEVTVRPPAMLDDFKLNLDLRRLRQLRLDKFSWDLRFALRQTCSLDPFLSRWITEVAAAIAARTAATGPGLGELNSLPPSRWCEVAEEVVGGVLLALAGGEEDEQPLRSAVLAALARQDVVEVVESALPLLSSEPDEGWLLWLRARYLQTLGAAWQAAAQRLCSDFDVENDSVLDVVDHGAESARILLSDVSVGGGGLVEALSRRISEDPRRFDHLVVAALDASDLEEVDQSLRSAVALLADDAAIATHATAFRAATSGRLDRWKSLISALAARGVSSSHATVSALAGRLFRSGSSPASDETVHRCLVRWEELEIAAGFAVEHRSACALLAADPAVLDAVRKAAPAGHNAESSWAQSVLLGLLWVPAEARRSASLVATNRFVDDPPPTERTVVLDSLGDVVDGVDVDKGEWFGAASERLGHIGRCRLFSGTDDRARLKLALADLTVHPVELGSLHLYPRLEGLRRDVGGIHIELSLEEAPQ